MKYSVKTPFVVTTVGSFGKITLPAGAVLDGDESSTVFVIVSPEELSGKPIRVSEEDRSNLVDFEAQDQKKKFWESVHKCMDTITNSFDDLVVLDSGDMTQHLRDLGPVESWLVSSKHERDWLHHVNMLLPHPSLFVDTAVFPNNEKHFVLLLTQTW